MGGGGGGGGGVQSGLGDRGKFDRFIIRQAILLFLKKFT